MSNDNKLPAPMTNDHYIRFNAEQDVSRIPVVHPAYDLALAMRVEELTAAQKEHGDISKAVQPTSERYIAAWHKRQQAAFEAARDEKQMAAKIDFHTRKYADEIAVALANNPTITKDELVSALQKQLVQAHADGTCVDDVETVAKRLVAGKVSNTITNKRRAQLERQALNELFILVGHVGRYGAPSPTVDDLSPPSQAAYRIRVAELVRAEESGVPAPSTEGLQERGIEAHARAKASKVVDDDDTEGMSISTTMASDFGPRPSK